MFNYKTELPLALKLVKPEALLHSKDNYACALYSNKIKYWSNLFDGNFLKFIEDLPKNSK